VSHKVVPFDGHSPEDASSEFGGVTGRRGRREGSDLNHLYFFSKKFNTMQWNFVYFCYM